MIPKPGDSFRSFDGYKYHVVSLIKDGDYQLIIVKYYGKRKQWWHYEIWCIMEYELHARCQWG